MESQAQPCGYMRRRVALDAGTVKLVGTDPSLICSETKILLNSAEAYDAMA